MKLFKSVELFLQLILLASTVVISFSGGEESIGPLPFILGLALLQVISMIVNMTARNHFWRKDSWRKIHLIGIGVVILLILVAFLQDSSARTGDKDDKYSMAGLGTLIYTTIPAALLSLFYIVITYVEWRRIRSATN